MTHVLSIDPGKNTGAAIGFYDATTPYRLVGRYQIHDGVMGFKRWFLENRWRLLHDVDEIVCERFDLRESNDFAADLTPVKIEGALEILLDDLRDDGWRGLFTFQPPSDKGSLIGYPAWCATNTQRQRFRFDFLDRFGLFRKGAENDDSNDAITHALVYLKRAKHMPTMTTFWPGRAPSAEPTFFLFNSDISPDLRPVPIEWQGVAA